VPHARSALPGAITLIWLWSYGFSGMVCVSQYNWSQTLRVPLVRPARGYSVTILVSRFSLDFTSSLASAIALVS
jgi:hypothetical protein